MSSLWQQLLQVTDSQQCQLLGHRAPGLVLGVTSALWVFRAWLEGCQGWPLGLAPALPRAGACFAQGCTLLCPGFTLCSAQGCPWHHPCPSCATAAPCALSWRLWMGFAVSPGLLCQGSPCSPLRPEGCARGTVLPALPPSSFFLLLAFSSFPSLQLQVLHWPHQPKALLFPPLCQEVTRGMPGMPGKSGYEQPEVRRVPGAGRAVRTNPGTAAAAAENCAQERKN